MTEQEFQRRRLEVLKWLQSAEYEELRYVLERLSHEPCVQNDIITRLEFQRREAARLA